MASMGYEGYFLIVQDFINWGKSQGIVFGPGRGSAAGSIIAYALNITDLDPLKYGLLFERFLNPDRISMPDIDVDIQDTRRDEVIDYCANKYGHDHVSNIVTFGKMAARAAVRDVARVTVWPRWCHHLPRGGTFRWQLALKKILTLSTNTRRTQLPSKFLIMLSS